MKLLCKNNNDNNFENEKNILYMLKDHLYQIISKDSFYNFKDKDFDIHMNRVILGSNTNNLFFHCLDIVYRNNTDNISFKCCKFVLDNMLLKLNDNDHLLYYYTDDEESTLKYCLQENVYEYLFYFLKKGWLISKSQFDFLYKLWISNKKECFTKMKKYIDPSIFKYFNKFCQFDNFNNLIEELENNQHINNIKNIKNNILKYTSIHKSCFHCKNFNIACEDYILFEECKHVINVHNDCKNNFNNICPYCNTKSFKLKNVHYIQSDNN